eukprot:7339700-Pyramimonas_sp.AAC.1
MYLACLRPKKAGGDIIISLLPIVCRLYTLIREPYTKCWSADTATEWDAAVAGNSAFQEACYKAVDRELIVKLGVSNGCALLDPRSLHGMIK